MKVTKQVLSIPPYLSTSWEHVAAIRVEQGVLMVKLNDSSVVNIPGLDEGQLKEIFTAHEQFHEVQGPGPMGIPFSFGPEGLQGMPMQHDSSMAQAPDLPDEVLSKVSAISQALGVDNAGTLPQSHAGCNCFHCQIARAIGAQSESEEDLEEEVSDEELTFREWDIALSGEKLYTVTNPLDANEHYSVFLGEPVGCTCGQEHCSHIKAVLSS